MAGFPYWENEVPSGFHKYGSRMLNYDVPMINQSQTSSRSAMSSNYSGGSSAMSDQGPQIVVNVFDGTGQKYQNMIHQSGFKSMNVQTDMVNLHHYLFLKWHRLKLQ